MSLEEDYLRIREEKSELEKKLKDKEELLEEAIFLVCIELLSKIGGYPDFIKKQFKDDPARLIAKYANIEISLENKEKGSEQFADFLRDFPTQYCLKMIKKL